ncbi:MAG: hypothetical protein HS129_02725 [Leptospiraceae bacterium]|nr:hypothetical protein [Leptospiraceae bacterium]
MTKNFYKILWNERLRFVKSKKLNMKFYNYFSDQSELLIYLNGIFSGKGIYFHPDEFKKKETLRSNLKIYSKDKMLTFRLYAKNKKSFNFQIHASEILDIREDICKFQTKGFKVQIQAMTEDKVHVHVCGDEGDFLNIIYISGILTRNKFFRLLLFFSGIKSIRKY